jgi:exodeoxyribonuclease VII small subunit
VSDTDKNGTLEESMDRLEEIVGELDSGQYSLEESLSRFEEGLVLGKRCREILDRAEMKVKTLVDVAADGTPETKDGDVGQP